MRGVTEAKRIWLSVLGSGNSEKRGNNLCRVRGLSRQATEMGLLMALKAQNDARNDIKEARRIIRGQ